VGTVDFHLTAQENSLFDGLQDTGRVPSSKKVKVEMTTVDTEWCLLGKPPVSVIKCDIEGGELAMLAGASECIYETRPSILLEWHTENLRAFQVKPESLLEYAKKARYMVHAVPGLAEVRDPACLNAQMAFTESFFLLPQCTD